MFQGTKRIIELFDNDEFKPFIVQGDHGFGKTSYSDSLIADVYGHVFNGGSPLWNRWTTTGNYPVQDWFEYHIGFHPKEVLDEWQFKDKRDKWLYNRLKYPEKFSNRWQRKLYEDWDFSNWDHPEKRHTDKKRDFVYHWDDAGMWLHSLDFQDPFVKEAGKYMQVVRSDWACVIFSAISAEDIVSKIRGLRNAIIIDIIKQGNNESHPYQRTAEAYILRRTYRGRTWKDYQWRDRFNCHVPDDCFGWYHPLRDKYASIAKKRMRDKLSQREDLD